MAALGIDQVSSLSQEEIALITSGSLSSIVAAAFKADGFVGNLSGKQLNSISSSQFQQVNLGAIGGDAEKILSGSQLANATSSQLMAVANSDFANNLSKSQRNNLSKSQLGILFSGS